MGPPSPPHSTRPRKRALPLRNPEDLDVGAGEDDKDQISDEEDKKRRWTEAETKQFVFALMGPDGYWEKFLKNPTDTYKKVSTAFSVAVLSLSHLILRFRQGFSLAVSMSSH